MKTLSPKQQQIYDYIVSFSGLHGYPPSVREIGEYVGLKSPSTVHFHLKGLEAAGLDVYGGVNAPYIWLKTPGGMDSWRFF